MGYSCELNNFNVPDRAFHRIYHIEVFYSNLFLLQRTQMNDKLSIHIRFARIRASTWELLTHFVNKWSEYGITGQPLRSKNKPLTMHNMRVLDVEEHVMFERLQGLLDNTISYKDLLSETKNKKDKVRVIYIVLY